MLLKISKPAVQANICLTIIVIIVIIVKSKSFKGVTISFTGVDAGVLLKKIVLHLRSSIVFLLVCGFFSMFRYH